MYLKLLILLVVWFLGCMLIDSIISSNKFNNFWLRVCRNKARKYRYRDDIDNWVDTHICKDIDNEVVWSDLSKMIRKDTGKRVSSEILRGILYEKGYETVSSQVIDTYVFNVKYCNKNEKECDICGNDDN